MEGAEFDRMDFRCAERCLGRFSCAHPFRRLVGRSQQSNSLKCSIGPIRCSTRKIESMYRRGSLHPLHPRAPPAHAQAASNVRQTPQTLNFVYFV